MSDSISCLTDAVEYINGIVDDMFQTVKYCFIASLKNPVLRVICLNTSSTTKYSRKQKE